MRSRLISIATVALLALVGAACSSDDDSGSSATTEGTSGAVHNDADVAFAQGMIPHHRQAVEMAQMAAARAESDAVLDLAARIEAAQAPEIEELTGWLESWGEQVPTGSDMGMPGHGDSGMGMMSPDDMNALEGAMGADFDQMFLEMMIVHHEGAIEMAETQIADGEYPDAIALAQRIVDAQQGEIDEMNSILAGEG